MGPKTNGMMFRTQYVAANGPAWASPQIIRLTISVQAGLCLWGLPVIPFMSSSWVLLDNLFFPGEAYVLPTATCTVPFRNDGYIYKHFFFEFFLSEP